MSAAEVLNTALEIAACGLRVVFTHSIDPETGRCTCGRSTCPERSWGKHPIPKRWQQLATDDAEGVRALYDGIRFTPNISVVLGPQSDGRYLVAIDIDDADRMAALEEENGPLPESSGGRTPRGRRLLFSLPDGTPRDRVKNITGVGGDVGVDLKAAGGQVVVIGRNAGGEYTDFDPAQPIAELPAAWALAILDAPKPPPDVHEYTPHTLRDDARAKKRYEKYLDKAIVSECRLLAQTKEGQRNTATYLAAFRLLSLANGMHLTSVWGHVRTEVERAAVAAGLSAAEARRTIASADSAVVESGAVRVPREVPPPESSSSYPPPVASAVVGDLDAIALIEDNGSPAKIAENVARMLAVYPKGLPRMNRLKEQAEWKDGKTITDVDELDIQGWLVAQPHSHRVRVGIDGVHGGIVLAADRNAFEPVQDYLGGVVWDRKPRIATFGPTYLGTDDTKFIRDVIRCFFIAACARAWRPGCQVDTMLILRGEQGIQKSSAFRALAGSDWFSDSQIIIGKEPDCYQKLLGTWIHEFPEVESHLSNEKKQDELKGYMTSREDNFRPSYGRNAIRRARRNTFVGTTNKERLLSDDTGSRRFHIVFSRETRLNEIERDRNQLWAEAMCLFRENIPWWLGKDMAEVAAEEADRHFLVDPWEERLPTLLASVDAVTTSEMLRLLGVDPGKYDKAAATKAGIALRRCGGWVRIDQKNALGQGERYHYRRDPKAQPRGGE